MEGNKSDFWAAKRVGYDSVKDLEYEEIHGESFQTFKIHSRVSLLFPLYEWPRFLLISVKCNPQTMQMTVGVSAILFIVAYMRTD